MLDKVIEIAKNNGTEEDARIKIATQGWPEEEINRFDKYWDKLLEDLDPESDLSKKETFELIKGNMDYSQFPCMK